MKTGRRGSQGLLVLALIIVAALVGARSGESHEKHRKSVAPSADSAAAESIRARAATGEGGRPEGVPPASAPAEAVEPPFEMPPVDEMIVHHLHNKVIHLPIVLAPVALVLLLAERRRQGAGALAPLFIWGAALSSVAAFFSGRAQAGAFDDGPKEWLVGTHQTWGIVTMVALLLWAVAASWSGTRRHAWIVGAIATLAVFVAALYGGLVAHG